MHASADTSSDLLSTQQLRTRRSFYEEHSSDDDINPSETEVLLENGACTIESSGGPDETCDSNISGKCCSALAPIQWTLGYPDTPPLLAIQMSKKSG